MEDLRSAEKIFVRKGSDTRTAESAEGLLAKLQSYNPENTLFWVVPETECERAGTVEVVRPGLIKGYIDRFAPVEAAYDCSAVWFDLCRHALCVHTAGCAPGTVLRPPRRVATNLIRAVNVERQSGWWCSHLAATDGATPSPLQPGAAMHEHRLVADTEAISGAICGYSINRGFSEGIIYTASLYVRIPSDSQVQVVGAVLRGVPSVAMANADMRLRDVWQRVWVSGRVPQGADHLAPALYVIGKAGGIVQSTCWQPEIGPAATPYIPTCFGSLQGDRQIRVVRAQLGIQGLREGVSAMRLVPAWLLSALLLLPSPALARTLQFLEPFSNFVIHDPSSKANAPGAYYGATGPDPEWQIQQWDIAGGRLSPFQRLLRDGHEVFVARSLEDTVRLVRDRGGVTVSLLQDGSVLPCTRPNGHPLESDLLVQPLDRDKVHTALRLQPAALGTLTSVRLIVTVSARYGMTAHPKGCYVNQGNSGVSLILNNTQVSPPQTLFYQLGMIQPCAPIPASRYRECQAGTRNFGYFFRSNPFGVDDRLPLLGAPFIRDGETRRVDTELLPRLREVISRGPEGMDRDPSHWSIGSTYAGQAIWGDFRLATAWQDFQILLTTP